MAWSRIQGHDHWIDAFARVRERNRLAHAYLFVGPAGVGKRLFARELAKSIFCETPAPATSNYSSCDRCDACVQIEAGTHPDFFAVAKPEDANEFPIEIMRELCMNFGLKSASGKGKVAILDDADDLNDASANCFLKTLEEPPQGSMFILLGTSSQQQLATIVSRCHVVRFSPLAPTLVAELLQKRGVDAPLIRRLVRLSQGSPGRAFELAEPELWSFRETFLRTLAKPGFDPVGLAKQFIEFAEDAGKETSLHRRRALQAITLVVESFQDARLLRLGTEPTGIDESDRPLLEALAGRLGDEKYSFLIERFLQTEEHLNRYIQLGLVLEGLVDGVGQILDAGIVPASLATRR